MIDFPLFYEKGIVIPHWAWEVCGFAYFLIFILYYRRVVYNVLWAETEYPSKVFLFLLIMTFCVCEICTGDFIGTQETVKTYHGIDHLEVIYPTIIEFVHNNYLAFRLLLWGGGVFLMTQSFKNFGIDPYRSLFYLFASYVTYYSYTRAGVAMTVFFYGFSLFFYKERKNIFLTLIGVTLILLSFFFHRSMVLLILITPLCLLPFYKKFVPLYLFAVIIVFVMANYLLQQIFSIVMKVEDLSEQAEIYQLRDGTQFVGTLLSRIVFLWQKMVFHIPFWITMIALYNKRRLVHIPVNILTLSKLLAILYVFFMLMLFVYGSDSPFYYRYEGMMYIPLTIMVNYLYKVRALSRKTYSRLLLLGALCLCWNFFYRSFIA